MLKINLSPKVADRQRLSDVFRGYVGIPAHEWRALKRKVYRVETAALFLPPRLKDPLSRERVGRLHLQAEKLARAVRYIERHLISAREMAEKYKRRGIARPKNPKRLPRDVSPRKKLDILVRDGFKCVYCGHGLEDGVKLVVDHRVSVKDGGSSDDLNLATACQECNAGKGRRSIVGGKFVKP